MAAYVCTIAGGKGGVGRTTTALNVGAFLQREGYDTVVVDADLGMADAGAMLGVEPDPTLHDVLAGHATVREALTEAPNGVSFLGGKRTLEAYADADAADLRGVIDTLRSDYDVVLVDSSAGILHETTVALGAADGIILVTTASEAAMYDASKIAQLAERVDGNVVGVVVTCIRDGDDTEVADVEEQLDHPVLGVVPEDVSIAGGDPLVDTTGSSPATESYRELTSNLIRIFFEGANPAQLEMVFEDEWFEQESPPEEADAADSEDSDDSDDVLGLFN